MQKKKSTGYGFVIWHLSYTDYSHRYVAGGFLKTDCPLCGFTLLSRTLRVIGDNTKQPTTNISLLALFTGLLPVLNSPITGYTALRPLAPLWPLRTKVSRTAESDFHVLTKILHVRQVLVIANIAVAEEMLIITKSENFHTLTRDSVCRFHNAWFLLLILNHTKFPESL